MGVLDSTWFSVAGRANVVHTKRGSRPGSPLADILFAYLLAEIQNTARSQLEQQRIFHVLPLRWLPSLDAVSEPGVLDTCSPGLTSRHFS